MLRLPCTLFLGSGGLAVPKPVRHFLDTADVILGIGCSFTETNFGVAMPKGTSIIHATLDPDHLNKDVPAAIGLVGDAGLTLAALLAELKPLIPAARDAPRGQSGPPFGERVALQPRFNGYRRRVNGGRTTRLEDV